MVLAHRIIPIVLYRGEDVVKGAKFDSWRSIGHVRQAVRLYNMREVDELVCLDIGATKDGTGPNFELIRDLATDMYSPLTVGGGMSTLEHFRLALENGADKIAINSHASVGLIESAAKRFGSQAVVVSIDAKRSSHFAGFINWNAMSHCGREYFCHSVVSWAKAVENYGAGEIILGSVERDGTMDGYDLDLIKVVSSAVRIPVVAVGGAGNYGHLVEAINAGAHAVGAGAMFAFTDATPSGAAEYMHERGIPVRRRTV